MRTVHLVRHGDTMDNAATPGPELERSWEPEGLAEVGRVEARKAGKELARLGIKVLISSDLPRAKQSAKIMADVIGIEPQFHSQLRTWNTGDLSGKLKRDVEGEVARLVRFTPDRIIHDGESFDQFRRRVFAALSDILATHSGAGIAIVIHARIERLIAAWKAAGAKADHSIDADVFLAKPERPGHIEACRFDPATLKLAHTEVAFHDARPTGDRCGICRAYAGVNRCTKVSPPMDADDWCAVGVRRGSGKWFEGPRL